MKYEAVIGLEIHLQLKTASKMFCSCANLGGDAAPGTAVCPICMGHPGTLPVINKEAVKQGIRLALALNGTIAHDTRFDRKNYFYPDLPKGYQISQFDHPISSGGYLVIPGSETRINFERLHLEEDAAKNVHRGGETLVDFNRAGVPLAEMVTKPDFRKPEDARAFLQELRLIARYCGASDADMEKGQMRCDANISLRPLGEEKLYTKIEVKNLNSMRSVERALAYEIERQTKLWEEGKPPAKTETRGWDEVKGETILQRTKEGSSDYRYFPEPDLPPLHLSDDEIAMLAASVPELPEARRQRFIEEYGLRYEDAAILITEKAHANYFEEVASELIAWAEDTEKNVSSGDRKQLFKLCYSWLTSEVFKHLNAAGETIDQLKITPEDFAEFLILVHQKKVNSSAAQTILAAMYKTGEDPHAIAEREKLFVREDVGDIRNLVVRVIAENPIQVVQYRGGKESVLQFLIGKVMKASGGSVHPEKAKEVLKEELGGKNKE